MTLKPVVARERAVRDIEEAADYATAEAGERMFEIALDALDRDGDLVNQVLEVTLERDAAPDVAIRRYALPKV
jgi:hypothetical protein